MDIWGSKVVAPACVDWGPFIVDPWITIWWCTHRMSDLWGLVNQHSSIIVVVEQYPTIPLEMNIGIVYEPLMDSPVCGIVWKTCTRPRWDLNWPYGIIVKGCHMWPIRGRAYVILVRFISLQGWLLIQIYVILSDMSDSLFTAPLIEMHVYYNDDGLSWLVNDDEHDYIMMMYLLDSIDCCLAKY
jgi:hypothetical protein